MFANFCLHLFCRLQGMLMWMEVFLGGQTQFSSAYA